MSIENQLKTEFQQYANRLHYPRELDERIHRLMARKAGKRGKTARIALIAACICLFSGIAYASSLLYSMQTGKVSAEVSQDVKVQLPDSLNAGIRTSFQEIRARLAPGESAVVYVSELEKRKLPALTKLTRPVGYTDLNEWAALAEKRGTTLKKPTVMPQGFVLNRGELEGPVGMVDAQSYFRYEALLKEKAAESKQTIAWQPVADTQQAPDSLKTPGLIYANPRHDQIEIRYQVIPAPDKKLDMKISTGTSTIGEKVAVNGKDGYYTVNDNTFLSETGLQRTVSWMEEQGSGTTIIYQVSTSSSKVGKNELLLVANGLME